MSSDNQHEEVRLDDTPVVPQTNSISNRNATNQVEINLDAIPEHESSTLSLLENQEGAGRKFHIDFTQLLRGSTIYERNRE